MSDLPPELARMPSWADATPPLPGSCCRACRGTRWWTERRDSKGWRRMRFLPPSHLPSEVIRRKGRQRTPWSLPLVVHRVAPICCSDRQASGWMTRGTLVARLRAASGSEGARASRTDNGYADFRFMISVTACIASIAEERLARASQSIASRSYAVIRGPCKGRSATSWSDTSVPTAMTRPRIDGCKAATGANPRHAGTAADQ
jgi:hypothetical protein